ncbi:MAG: hypothetical protein IPK67_13785 [Planctomycetes bacterium]|nr:hypothetical protein [Planctomycetota bacterium]
MTKLLRVVLGVHAHWTGAQWNSVEDVLDRALTLALEVSRRHGAACALDFDARGLEEIAGRSPRVLERLRAALESRRVEWVGGSYAQPVSGLCLGESPLRQRVQGQRAVERLLGLRPTVLWEGAPLVTPQAPQLLAASGIRAVGLVPAFEALEAEAPSETRPWIRWRGTDGSELSAATAQRFSLAFARGAHGSEGEALAADPAPGLLLAWVPLDAVHCAAFWDRLEQLRADGRFRLEAASFTELAASLAAPSSLPSETYRSDEFFHGAAPAKNGDLGLRSAAWCEEQLLAAESLAALLARVGGGAREDWPAWELEEAWRELCLSQHHSIAANESLLAGVAECSVERSLALSQDVHERTLFQLGQRVEGLEGGHLVLNPLGWERDVLVDNGVARAVPAFGYRVVDPYELEATPLGRVRVRGNDDRIALVRGRMRVEIDKRRGVIEQITTRDFPEGLLDPARPLLDFTLVRGGREVLFEQVDVQRNESEELETDELTLRRETRGGGAITVQVAIEPLFDALWMRIQSEDLPRPDPGSGAAFGFALRPRLAPDARLRVDHPYGVGEILALQDRERRVLRAAGSRIESERVERLARPFTALRFVDLFSAETQRGMLYVHDGSPSFSRVEGGVRHLLSGVDALDEDSYEGALMTDLWVIPHAGMGDAERMRRAMECTLGNPRFAQSAEIRGGGSLPGEMGALQVTPEHVLATAFWREAPATREHLRAPLVDGSDSNFAVRLVEFGGEAARVRLRVAGQVTRAARTDPRGEVQAAVAVTACAAAYGPPGMPWSELQLDLRPHEIATLRFL